MKDFTLDYYKIYLEVLKEHNFEFITFENFLTQKQKQDKIVLLRHDVDIKPNNALAMAEVEASFEVKSSFYFRTKPNVFKPDIIKRISELGHEVGYHYECLSDTKGDYKLALEDFEKNLKRLREICNVTTVCMHGRPLSPYDNRDIWKIKENHEKLVGEYNILGELYLDVDYSDIVYISDTGRNWMTGKHNIRDTVASNKNYNFNNSKELLAFFREDIEQRIIVFQIHPGRWSINPLDYIHQWTSDMVTNMIKKML